jgi:parallel beta-helix repeat protein
VVDENTVYSLGNGFWIGYAAGNIGTRYTNFTNNIGYGLTGAPDAMFYLDGSSGGSSPLINNRFVNNTVSNSSYGVYIVDYASNNYFENLTVWNATSYAYYAYSSSAAGVNNNNFTNISFFSSSNSYINHVQTGGGTPATTYFANLTLARLDDSSSVTFYGDWFPMTNDSTVSNTNVSYDFVSINTSDVPEFNRSAYVTTYTEKCPTTVYKKYGFPSSRSEILTTGYVYETQEINWCTEPWANFNVTDFSGYALPDNQRIRRICAG